jgi:DNA-binding Xre family transcriptional regulator
MSTVITKSGPTHGITSATSDPVTMEELKAFAKLLQAYLNCDEEDRQGITSMTSIATDPDATDDEIEAALETLREGLFPTEPVDLGIDRELEPDEESIWKQMDFEEETFASRLDRCMKTKRMSQVELAAAIGVGQPAISMMLSRNCRPQHRTVEKIARALDVPPNDLWPGFGSPDNAHAAASTHSHSITQ